MQSWHSVQTEEDNPDPNDLKKEHDAQKEGNEAFYYTK